jgi:hypothetical protein
MNLKDTVKKILINEISSKIVDKLVQQWTKDTNLDPSVVKEYIDEFSGISSSLPVQFRDITRLDFPSVKKIVDARRAKTRVKTLTTKFKTMEYPEGQPKPSNTELKSTIRKYNEIYPFLTDRERKSLENTTWLQFLSKTNQFFETKFASELLKKIKKEEPNWTEDQIMYYLLSIVQNYNEIPENTPPFYLLSISEIEHIIDGLPTSKKVENIKSDITDIPQVLNPRKNLLIYAPTGKPDCIKLKNGRPWCTSREGSNNLYYNYRFDKNLTLYYVIDEDLPFDNLNFATVILVDPDGGMRLADASNSGDYGGHVVLPWEQIVKKLPKLDGLKELFVPKPLTENEKSVIQALRRARSESNLNSWAKNFLESNPTFAEEYSPYDIIELWMEVNSQRLSDMQYASLDPELKKKYIGLGHDLSSDMINNSESSVLTYYANKKLESILKKSLKDLSDEDIALLNNQSFKKHKTYLKDRFITQLSDPSANKDGFINVDLRSRNISSPVDKFIKLYGLDLLISKLPLDIKSLSIVADDDGSVTLKFGDDLSRLQNLEQLELTNCVNEFPIVIKKLNLEVLTISDKRIKKVPNWVGDLHLFFLNLSKETYLDPKIEERLTKNVKGDFSPGIVS